MALQGLEGKRVLVTAAASGIGKVVATEFADAGATVHVCDVAAEALELLAAAYPDIRTTLADVRIAP